MIAELAINQANLFIFCKDKRGKFLFCNEKFAEAAGLDSPTQIAGKDDYDLIWRDQASQFQQGDQLVLQGNPFMNVQEIMRQSKKMANILVTKQLYLNQHNKCMGVIGHFIDVTGYNLKKTTSYYDDTTNRFYLGDSYPNTYLSRQQYKVFRLTLLGYTAQQIADILSLSRRTVEGYIDSIKLKMHCQTKNEIVTKAIITGLLSVPPEFI